MRYLKLRWERSVREVDARYVEKYYDAADEYIEELMWWHTLVDDNSPLAYVVALEFASSVGCKTSCLDFGSGVGSGALLFRSHGFDVTLTDISRIILSFCKYTFEAPGLDASFIDLKQSKAARDCVRFHYRDGCIRASGRSGRDGRPASSLPEAGRVRLRALRLEVDPARPEHLVQDVQPVFDRFAELGFKEVFRDE